MATARPSTDAATIERVHIERRGGFAGLRASADCDAATLGGAGRAAVCRLIDNDSARRAAAPAPGADRFGYRLRVIHRGGHEHTLDVAEDAMPARLAALVRLDLP